jgi:RHS repeat-associated protein
MEELEANLRELEEQAQAREAQLASPAFVAERQESETAFVGISDAAAEALLVDEFGAKLDGFAVPDLDDLLDGREIARFVDDRTVVLAADGERPAVLVEAPRVVRAPDDDGAKRPIDLSLEPAGGGDFEPANAAAEVSLPDELAEGVDVGETTVTPGGSADGELLSAGDDEQVLWANAQTDTDVAAVPVTNGVEFFWQLRSPRSPEELSLELDLPAGAVAQKTSTGAISVVRDGDVISTVSTPVAVDAQGQPVEVTMDVVAGQVVLSVVHRDRGIAYPVLVDPVVEDWYGTGTQTWFHQHAGALAGLQSWFRAWSGVAENTYAHRTFCYAPVSCYKWHSTLYNPDSPDGLHIYVRPAGEAIYPAGSAGSWIYEPPGTTTRVAEVDLGIKYLRQRSTNQYPNMYTGIWRPGVGWVTSQNFGNDLSSHWNTHVGANAPGPQQVVFGFWTPVPASLPNWRDGYVGAAVIELTDPESPEIRTTGVLAVDRETEEEADPTKWIRDGLDLRVAPQAVDPGLGVKLFVLNGPAVGELVSSHPCTGVKSNPCPDDWTLDAASQFEFTSEELPEGDNTFNLYAGDPLPGHTDAESFHLKVDRGQPSLALSGALWNAREVTPAPPGGQIVLQPGQHQLTVTATDPAQGPAPAGTRSGVEKVEIKVDDSIVHNSNVACPAGNCPRTVNWSFDTAQYGGGAHTVDVTVTDGAGNASSNSFVINTPYAGELVHPTDGAVSSSKLVLQAKANVSGFTGVQFQYRIPSGAWTTVGGLGTALRDDRGDVVTQTTHPLNLLGMHSPKLTWDAATTLKLMSQQPGPIELRAVFVGGPTADSPTVSAEIDATGLKAGNAQADIGPGDVDLITGNFGYTATDADLAGFGQGLSLSRTFNSLNPNAGPNGPFGPGWVSGAPVFGVADFTSLEELTDPALSGWVDVTSVQGTAIRFEKLADGTYKPHTVGFEGLKLVKSGSVYKLTDLAATTTTFAKPAGASQFVPSEVTQAAGSGAEAKSGYTYEVYNGAPRLKRIIAPAPSGIDCMTATMPRGCRALELVYTQLSVGSRVTGLNHITWHPGWGLMFTESVAQFEYHLSGSSAGRLSAAWDPRISPALKETYAYNSDGRLSTITPPGQAAWQLSYLGSSDINAGKLNTVMRIMGSPFQIQTSRMVWNVALSGSGSPYPMSANDLDTWGQTDRPTDATAIIPPGQSTLTGATVNYLNADGTNVNTAEPGGRIETTEHNAAGQVVRSLSPANRATALAAGGGSATLAGLLSTYFTYSAGGDLVEELGPQHEIKLESGQVVDARAHTVITYDEGSPLPADQKAHLPTTERVGAQVDPSQPDVDVRTIKREYDWNLREETATIIDPGSGNLNLAGRKSYNAAGLPSEFSMPESSGQDAGTYRAIYYSHDGSASDPACRNKPEWFNMLCKSVPAAQPGTPGLPDLRTKTITYNRFGDIATVVEQVGSDTRTLTNTYDSAGRKTKQRVESTVGAAVLESTTGYSTTTGRATTVSTSQGTTTSSYDSFGRLTSYTDADGNVSTTSYNSADQPITASDGKGTQTYTHDPVTGDLTQVSDSDAGTFTAAYDANGRVISKTYPNGLQAATTYDEAGSPVRLTYTKTTNCSSNCTWMDEQVADSIHGQRLSRDGDLSSQDYNYDDAGRLTRVEDDVHAPAAIAGCTIRSYLFDDNSNRTAKVTKAPSASGDCDPGASGQQTSYSYDSADRLTGSGVEYDAFSRMTEVPSAYANGGALSYTYYANDQVRSVEQDGLSKTYLIDPIGRQRQTVAEDGTTHTETLHYSDDSDSPSWTSVTDSSQQEVSWTRNVRGIEGDLAAIRTVDDQGSSVELQLSDLNGQIVATASTDPNATQPLERFEADEFGNPRQQDDRRYAWHGASTRRTELQSGVVQMGERSYLPAIGRFTTVDPEKGGSANDYEYGNGDPINNADPTGRNTDGCTISFKRYYSKNSMIHMWAWWNCPKSGWWGPVTIMKVSVQIEREVRGTMNTIFKGHFERVYGPVSWAPDKRQHNHRAYGVKDHVKCHKYGWEYKYKITLNLYFQNPIGAKFGGNGSHYITKWAWAITRCRR